MSCVGADIGSTIHKAAEQFQILCSADKNSDDERARQALIQLKRLFIHFPTYLNPLAPSTTAQQEIILVRETLEHAALLCARTKDLESFEEYFSQLSMYYDPKVTKNANVKPSVIQLLLVGLNLARLLVVNKTSEFHTTYQRIPLEDTQNVNIKYPVQLERYLMEGSYKKLLCVRSQAPSNEFVPIVEMLELTVRREILNCIPKAYKSLKIAESQEVLMLRSPEEVEIEAKRMGWIKDSTGESYVFNIPEENDSNEMSKKDLRYLDLLTFQIGFAADMQRVV